MNQKLAERIQSELLEKENLFKSIDSPSDLVPLPVRKVLFDQAWSDGHAYGDHEVTALYDKYLELQEHIQAWYADYEDTCKKLQAASDLWK